MLDLFPGPITVQQMQECADAKVLGPSQQLEHANQLHNKKHHGYLARQPIGAKHRDGFLGEKNHEWVECRITLVLYCSFEVTPAFDCP